MRTIQRWQLSNVTVQEHTRPTVSRPKPSNKLSEDNHGNSSNSEQWISEVTTIDRYYEGQHRPTEPRGQRR